MNENPQNHPNSSEKSEVYNEIQRQQDLQLQQEELRLRQEEQRLEKARRNMIVSRLLGGIYFLVSALEILLLLRFLLRLAAANPDNLLSQIIYSWSNVFIGPFINLFGEPSMNDHVIETNTIAAMIIYGLLGVLGGRIIEIWRDK
ncbi:YggT family protein [Aphanothece sacrum]|uniref:YggT family protein n=1 Tax=Aphanothece sacrum FPU1 TaxID=1920663 RepID=A0A401IML2_APHSA|nr:YggT family protein [Aphanothece sacrum]GBF82483.1 hypothetical protein AsFPU1_3913 [Aphanothece sacrum FPU1]GBF85782.1 hypothetical protein AsFPU3_2847 [Aphanothece sacrum FPU3]